MSAPREGDGPRARERLLGARSPVIPVELLLFGTWGLLAPYAGRPFDLTVNTQPNLEVIDHVVPGVAVLAVACLALARHGRSLTGSLVVLAAGAWMTATHVPLLKQAADGQETMSAALWHSIPGMVILALGVVAVAVDSGTAGAGPAPGEPGRAAEGDAGAPPDG